MSSEYQRITKELTMLQQQIFYNELPALLISYSQQEDPEKSVTQLITSLLAIQKQQFISGIGRNVAQVKQDHQKLKIQNEEFRDLINRQEVELGRVKAAVEDLMADKNYLTAELDQLKLNQQSLAKLINSTSIEHKIKQILTQNQHLKQQLHQRDSLLQIKQLQIKQYIQKQLYYTSEITALQNDNTLFHRDLTAANYRIQNLGKEKLELEGILQGVRQRCLALEANVGKEVQKYNEAELKYKQDIVKWESITRSQKLKNQNLMQQIQRQQKLCQNIKQQANYLRECLQKSQQDIQNLQQIEHNNKIKLVEYEEQIGGLKGMIDQIQIQRNRQVQDLNRALMELTQHNKQQICKLMSQIEKYRGEIGQLQNQFQAYRNRSLQQKQEQQEIHNSAMLGLQKQLTEISTKQKQQLQGIILDLEKKLQNNNEQIGRLEDQIKIQKQNAEYYKIYLEENNQLRSQLDRINNSLRQNQKNLANSTPNHKYLFYLLKVGQELQILKRDNINLRNLVATLAQGTRRWAAKQINKMACAIIEKKSEQESEFQWQKYEATKKHNVQENKSTKELKTLNQKYKLLRQQNMKYGNRLEQILKH